MAWVRLLLPPSGKILVSMPFGFGEGLLPLVSFPALGGLRAFLPSACLDRSARWVGLLPRFPSCLLEVPGLSLDRLRDFLLALEVLVFSFIEDLEDLGLL